MVLVHQSSSDLVTSTHTMLCSPDATASKFENGIYTQKDNPNIHFIIMIYLEKCTSYKIILEACRKSPSYTSDNFTFIENNSLDGIQE